MTTTFRRSSTVVLAFITCALSPIQPSSFALSPQQPPPQTWTQNDGTIVVASPSGDRAAAQRGKFKKLKLDDGSQEQVVGILDGNSRQPLQIVVANRFTPSTAMLPFQLEQAHILLPKTCQAGDTGLRESMTFDVLIYLDPTSSGDPSNAELVHRQSFQVVPSDRKFLKITLSTPVLVSGGDVWIGFTNSLESGVPAANYVAALDTKSSKQRSWIFYTPGGNFAGDALGTAQVRSLIDLEGIPGNWMIRGRGRVGNNRADL